MERLPLLVLEPAAAAILPGERRRLHLATEAMQRAIALASREGTGVLVAAFDPAMRREGETPAVEADRLLPTATACALLHADLDEGFAVLRGLHRASAEIGAGLCDGPEEAFAGTVRVLAPRQEAIESDEDLPAFSRLCTELEALDLVREPARLQSRPLEARIDRLAHALALPPWVQAELVCTRTLLGRIEALQRAGIELAMPGASFRPGENDRPYRDPEEHLEDLVRLWDSRAQARVPLLVGEDHRARALVQVGGLRRRRRAAALRERAIAARIARRLAASARQGTLPPLESIRMVHELGQRDLEALLAAGLADHQRLGDPMRRAARLLPPGEMPLAAWIDALEAGAFSLT